MRTLEDLRTDQLLYDPKSKGFAERIKADIPEFRVFRGRGKILASSMFTYIILMYDINSPLWRDVPDYYERKYEAARIANFPSGEKKKEFNEYAEKILLGKDKYVNACAIAYVTQFALPEYTQLIAYTTLLASETNKIIAGRGGSGSTKIVEETGKKIRELQQVLFNAKGYDESKEMRMALYSRIEKDKLRLRPEEIIEDLTKDGELPDDFTPYKESVKTTNKTLKENLKFIGDKPPKK
ncbi:MAG: hypothetical protein WC961_07425 [Anaerovoracaceae bacterium]|jgi:hypothetical protein